MRTSGVFSRFFIPVLLLALGGGLAASGCEEDLSPEEQVRKVLDDGVAALEDNDLGAAMDLVSEQYKDERDRDRRSIKQLAFVLLRRGKVRVLLRDVKIEVKGETATASMQAFAVQGAQEIAKLGDLIPKSARQMSLQVKLAKEDGEWLVTAIDGDRMGSPGG